MQINVSYDPNVSAPPTAVTDAINYVVNLYDNMFTNNISINILVKFGALNGPAASTVPGTAHTFNFGSVVGALEANLVPGTALPIVDPTGGAGFEMATAEGKALGLLPAFNGLDGKVTFASDLVFDYGISGSTAASS